MRSTGDGVLGWTSRVGFLIRMPSGCFSLSLSISSAPTSAFLVSMDFKSSSVADDPLAKSALISPTSSSFLFTASCNGCILFYLCDGLCHCFFRSLRREERDTKLGHPRRYLLIFGFSCSKQ